MEKSLFDSLEKSLLFDSLEKSLFGYDLRYEIGIMATKETFVESTESIHLIKLSCILKVV